MRRRLPTGPACAALGALLLLGPLGAGPALAQDNEECQQCHGRPGLSVERDGRDLSLFVDLERFDESIHSGMDCIFCHLDLDGVEEYPHDFGLDRVECTDCHDDDDGPVTAYRNSTHGRLAEEGEELAPLCQDCHGSHYVLPLDDRDSSISPFNVPAMCAQCHADDAPVARAYDLPQERILERYRQSIHGEGLYQQGLSVTAVCTSCHTGHDVLPHADPSSTIHKDNIVATCMACHGRIEEVHRKVIAGDLWEAQGVVPICVECHSPHEARKVFYDTNMSNADCLSCHADGGLVASDDGRSLFVDEDEHAGSVHGRNAVSCAQCHAGVTPSVERSCSTITERVNCSLCHEAEVADYEAGRHGALLASGDANAPYCTDCHGDHGTLEHRIPEGASPELKARLRLSPTYSRNVPELCARCHREGAAAAERYLGAQDHIIERYTMSIHGKGLLESGLSVTAVCTDCHTPHKELPADDPESMIHQSRIAETCGQCHDGIYEQFQSSVHSPAGNPEYVQMRDMPPLPHCDDCHPPHTMARTDRPEFQLGVMEQCGQCHAELTEAYFKTYHGKVSALGDATRAKCNDCHGGHDIHSTGDERSTLHLANIVETCGACHAAAHPGFTGYLTHANHHDAEKYPILYYAFVAMTALLVSVFSFFGLHTLAWLPRSWKLRKLYREELAAIAPVEKQYLRFSAFHRALHLTVILSFFGLAITGMVLKFSHTGWARFLSQLIGGVDAAGWIHRLCAIATFGYMAVHLWDVRQRWRASGQSLVRFLTGPDTLLPMPRDVADFWRTMKWFLGRGKRPTYGRWTYWEKFDYFAVFWGVLIIGTTGLFLWFPEFFTHFMPGWTINVATIIHSDEALLATGFIFTVHFFNTHFRPEKFPMDPVIFTGRMRLKELKHERPEVYARLVKSGDLDRYLVDPASPAMTRIVTAFGFAALLIGFTLVVLIVVALLTS